MMIGSQVNFPPVRIKLHWPDRWCSYCLAETEYLPGELYRCISCGVISVGKTEYVEGKVTSARGTEPDSSNANYATD